MSLADSSYSVCSLFLTVDYQLVTGGSRIPPREGFRGVLPQRFLTFSSNFKTCQTPPLQIRPCLFSKFSLTALKINSLQCCTPAKPVNVMFYLTEKRRSNKGLLLMILITKRTRTTKITKVSNHTCIRKTNDKTMIKSMKSVHFIH